MYANETGSLAFENLVRAKVAKGMTRTVALKAVNRELKWAVQSPKEALSKDVLDLISTPSPTHLAKPLTTHFLRDDDDDHLLPLAKSPSPSPAPSMVPSMVPSVAPSPVEKLRRKRQYKKRPVACAFCAGCAFNDQCYPYSIKDNTPKVCVRNGGFDCIISSTNSPGQTNNSR